MFNIKQYFWVYICVFCISGTVCQGGHGSGRPQSVVRQFPQWAQLWACLPWGFDGTRGISCAPKARSNRYLIGMNSYSLRTHIFHMIPIWSANVTILNLFNRSSRCKTSWNVNLRTPCGWRLTSLCYLQHSFLWSDTSYNWRYYFDMIQTKCILFCVNSNIYIERDIVIHIYIYVCVYPPSPTPLPVSCPPPPPGPFCGPLPVAIMHSTVQYRTVCTVALLPNSTVLYICNHVRMYNWTLCIVPSTEYLAPGTWYLVPST